MTSKLRGGKTPPRLLADVKLYNPQHLPQSGYNILTDIPPPFEQGTVTPRLFSKRACHHTWALKPSQCSATLIDGLVASGTSKTAAYCTNCRCHLSLEIDCSERSQGTAPCPQREFPLHHFVHLGAISPGYRYTSPLNFDDWEDAQFFKCSNKTCSAKLMVTTRSARLRQEWVRLLTAPEAIAERATAVMSKDKSRFEGHAIPSPGDVLSNLKQYIGNSLKGDARRINGANKKWMLCLGEPCSELLHFLGFTKVDDDWAPPRPDSSESAPFHSEMNVILDDVDKELVSLVESLPEQHRRGLKPYSPSSDAIKEFHTLLGSKNYPTEKASRAIDLTQDEHPFYAGLGTVIDFSDTLIGFAYEQQIVTDPDNGSYYLECLQGIGTGRKSEVLQEKAAIEASMGRISLMDIRNAYKELGLQMEMGHNDDTIVGVFHSRVSDAGKQQEGALKRALAIIGQHRGSQTIAHHASDTISSYEQALSWLGATADMDESFITSMYSVKVNEGSSNESTARKCVEIIAESRKSTALRSWLATGELVETDMDPAQAYARLNVSDRTVDDETLLAAYDSGISDAPSQANDLKKALQAIAKDRNSRTLLSAVGSTDATSNAVHNLEEWPVGLENIGNTCYLNSLLQFYFSIKPLRDIVLDFDKYRMEIRPENINNKRVGSRPVTRGEVSRAQQFVKELKTLFETMITADKSQIAPEKQLARLTLVNPTHEEVLRRNSTISETRPSQGQAENHAPTIEEEDTSMVADGAAAESPIELMEIAPKGAYSSSEGTLVEATRPGTPVDDYMVIDSTGKAEQAKAFEDKENLSPSKGDTARPSTPDHTLLPLAESSPSRINEQHPPSPTRSEAQPKDQTVTSTEAEALPEPPNRPPPIPPRVLANNKESEQAMMRETEEYARQQDVTEVIGNVLFQLQCAIRGQAVDSDGEQLDEIKNLFFGKLKTTTTDAAGNARIKEEFFSDLKINVHSGPQDIYAAISAALDKQMVTVGTSEEPQFTTISSLPPILQIYPNRTGYDREKGPFKVNHHLSFAETIYMDRYLDSDDAALNARRDECWGWKDELKALNARLAALQKTPYDMDMCDTLNLTADYVDSLDPFDTLGRMSSSPPSSPKENEKDPDSPKLASALRAAASAATDEIGKLNAHADVLRGKISNQFSSLQSVPYRLHSVFIHRGMVTSGHYWIYIFDFEKGVWRKYNDEKVTDVLDPQREIFEQESGERPATPMFLVYVRAGDEGGLVQALRREVRAKSEGSGSGDVVMGGMDGAGEMGGGAGEGGEMVDVHMGTVETSEDDLILFGKWAGDDGRGREAEEAREEARRGGKGRVPNPGAYA